MIGPHLAVGPVGRDERSGVVDHAHAGRRRERLGTALSSPATLALAAASSASLKAPCSASHSATAARPSRTNNSRRAAAVIQAETLTPSSAAAAKTFSWTSGSTVIASLGDGFPLGIPKVYYHGRREKVPICAPPPRTQRMANRARWCSELARWSGGNGGNWMYDRTESGTADQS